MVSKTDFISCPIKHMVSIKDLKLMEPEGVDQKDKILDDVAKDGHNEEGLPPKGVGEGACEQGEHNRR